VEIPAIFDPAPREIKVSHSRKILAEVPCSRRGMGLKPMSQHPLPTLFRIIRKREQREILRSDHALFDEPVEIDEAPP
jgi:hypothetical protein